MAYYLDLFSPQTFDAFVRSSREITGVRQRHLNAANRIKPGDKLLCYLTEFGLWFGVLDVASGPFNDSAPIFQPDADPFTIRFKVTPRIVLEPQNAIPIRDSKLWSALSFTRDHAQGSTTWTGKLRTSLAPLSDEDGGLIERLLQQQAEDPKAYPVDIERFRKSASLVVRRANRDIAVTVPPAEEPDQLGTEDQVTPEAASRESHRIQALIADVGARMGMSIWIPRNDRAAVARERSYSPENVLDRLPLNYNDATLTTIENIDVIWIKRSSIARAFEVEHATSIYSGLLRMADLLALQPNMDIRLHIVAPSSKREKVFQEIRRPVFSLLERGPLAEVCTYISYERLRELSAEKHLEHMVSGTVLDDYAEEAD